MVMASTINPPVPGKLFELFLKAWPLVAVALGFFATLYLGQLKNTADIENINRYGSTTIRDFVRVQTEVNASLIKGQALQNQALEQMNRRLDNLERDTRERK